MDLVPSTLYTTTIAISLISLLIFLACYLFLLGSSSKVGHGREPPMAKGAWPIIGHLMLLGGTPTPHKTLGALAETYGPLFTIKLGSKRALVICNWETAKECYTKNDMVVSSRSKLVAIEHVAYNQATFGFAPYGPFWREIRKIVTVFLSNRHVELLSRVRVTEIKSCMNELYDVWSTKMNESGYLLVEMKQWFTELVFNVVFQTMAGKRYFGSSAVVNEKEAQKSVKALRDFMHSLGVCTVADAVPLLRWMNYGVRAMKETAKELDVILDEWLVEHREKRSLGEKVDESDHQDFMDMMLSVVDGGATIGGFDASTINKATTLALILGATDTSTVTLTWVICLLLKNPHALKKAKEELNSQIGEERFINESDINKLVYLQAIVKETLRLYPPGPLSAPREFTEDCTLDGYHIKKGTRLITNLWKIQTDPNIWSDPLEFKPERFLTTHKDVDVRGHHFELLPFGSGRRICPGISFGLHMIHLTLANLLHSFEILGPSNEPIDMNENLVMTNEKATPLEIMVKPCLSPKYYTTMSSEC